MNPASRIFDALANRLREGLRVIEDELRFGVGTPENLLRNLKCLRHEALDLERALFRRRPRMRSVETDTGRHIPAPSSSARRGSDDLLDASFSRVQETCRSLEEQLKVHEPSLASRAEALRYQAYALQENIWAPRARQWPLYALITTSLSAHPLEKLVSDLVRGGVQAIQLREKALPDRRLLALARKLHHLVEQASGKKRLVSLILNDRPDIAAAAGFDGVHVGQGDIPPRDIRRLFGNRLFIGLSTHSERQASLARGQGADYIGIGPVFPTVTKPHLRFLGLPKTRRMIAASGNLPHVCIGGISNDNVLSVAKAGARGVALCTGLIQARNPMAASRLISRVILRQASR
ncbi:MAG: thiamine phosphate synthase [Planctomycetota bacterium]